jgi:hypothetical protein
MTLINDEKVIPAPCQPRDKLQRESRKTLDSAVRNDGQSDNYVVMYSSELTKIWYFVY